MTYDDVRFTALEELREVLGLVDAKEVDRLTDLLALAPRIYTAGGGRSGLAMRGFAMRLMHLGKESFFVGEVATPALRSGDLLVIGSGSGATDSLVAICEKGKRLGARIALVTAADDSPMSRLADLSVRIPAATPKRAAAGTGEAAPSAAPPVLSRQPLASLFEQGLWLLLDGIVMVLADRLAVSGKEMLARHANLE